jgi:hypothetical protein
MRDEQIAKQAKLKERRKKFKEKKAIAKAKANATRTVGIERNAGDSSDIDGENHASKRSKLASRDPPGAAKNAHQTSVRVQAKGRRILTDPGRNNRRETTKALVSEKSKRGGRMSEQTTPAH